MSERGLRRKIEGSIEEDEWYMSAALRLAEEALESGEVPVGAVIVSSGSIVARSRNQVRLLRDPTAHAEIIAITQAAAALENERLVSTTLYVSLEPCAMCAGAIQQARIDRVVYGAADDKAGACGSVLDLLGEPRLPHRPAVTAGVKASESSRLLRAFFAQRRGSDER